MRTYQTTAALTARLADPAARREAARALAVHLGAVDLLVFTRDAEIGVLLPAPGFPQTLPRGRTWRAFLARCLELGCHRDALPFPDEATTTGALGMATEGAGPEATAVLVLLGGAPAQAEVGIVRSLLPLLAAAFRGERAAQVATAQANVARESAERAHVLAAGLDAARAELQQAIWTRADFLASASHDLKNPLAAIKGTAQLLRRRATRAGTPETAGLVPGLASIDATATQMTALIDELLDLTRRQMDRAIELEPTPTDLVALARHVVGELAPTTDRHHLVVQSEAPELIGRWDARRLQRALGNLVGNAIKYSPAGGDVTVAISGEPSADPAWAVLAVSDRGLGIPAADLPRVFDRFHRASNVVGRIGGTGIGLASVQQTAEAHGGTITVDSREGAGSTFTLRLPLAPVEPPAAEPRLGGD